jgi:hypothetical protein
MEGIKSVDQGRGRLWIVVGLSLAALAAIVFGLIVTARPEERSLDLPASAGPTSQTAPPLTRIGGPTLPGPPGPVTVTAQPPSTVTVTVQAPTTVAALQPAPTVAATQPTPSAAAVIRRRFWK